MSNNWITEEDHELLLAACEKLAKTFHGDISEETEFRFSQPNITRYLRVDDGITLGVSLVAHSPFEGNLTVQFWAPERGSDYTRFGPSELDQALENWCGLDYAPDIKSVPEMRKDVKDFFKALRSARRSWE